jgi:hypothetical protein
VQYSIVPNLTPRHIALYDEHTASSHC